MTEFRFWTLLRWMLAAGLVASLQGDAIAASASPNTSSRSTLSTLATTSSCAAPTTTPSGVWPQRRADVKLRVMDQADWPYSPWNPPLVSQRVRAIFLADDDGTRRVQVTPAQVLLWVAEANRVYQASGIRLLFDAAESSGDWEELNSTLLNTMTGTAHPDWAQQMSLGNQIAAQTPDDMVVFFRWGPDAFPAGGGFSWTDYNFIVMPTFDTDVCGQQNIGLLAHEVGHYLGLPHTFSQVFGSIGEAESFFVSHGGDPETFNGDGRDETEPDPFVSTWDVQCVLGSITLDGVVFDLPRTNLMSYYYPNTTLAKSQTWTARQGLLVRLNEPMAKIVDGQGGVLVQGESRAPSVTQGSWGFQAMGSFLGLWSEGHKLIWLDGGVGSTLTTSFAVPAPGRYDVYGSFTAAPDFGIHVHYINGHAAAPVDLYSAIVLVTGPIYMGTFELSATNEWRVEIAGSNGRADPPRHGYGLDYILLAQAVSVFCDDFESGNTSAWSAKAP